MTHIIIESHCQFISPGAALARRNGACLGQGKEAEDRGISDEKLLLSGHQTVVRAARMVAIAVEGEDLSDMRPRGLVRLQAREGADGWLCWSCSGLIWLGG